MPANNKRGVGEFLAGKVLTPSKRQRTNKQSRSESFVLAMNKAQLVLFAMKKQGLLHSRIGLDSVNAKLPHYLFPFHGTEHTTPVLSLLARIRSFDPSIYLNEYKTGQFKLLRCMRGTLHLIPMDKVSIVQDLYNHMDPMYDRWMKEYEMDGDLNAIETHIMKVIEKHGPQSTQTIQKFLDKSHIHVSSTGRKNIGLILKILYAKGKLDFGVPFGEECIWRKSYRKYSIVMNVQNPTGTPTPCTPSVQSNLGGSTGGGQSKSNAEETSLFELARWYFELYGPASLNDFIWWTGKKITPCRQVLQDMIKQQEIVPVNVTDMDHVTFYILSSQKNELKDFCSNEEYNQKDSFSRLLPYEDALIKAYKETRNRFIDDDIGKIVIQRGEASPSVWVDGKIVGTWEFKNKPNHEMKVKLLTKIDHHQKKSLEQEANLVKRFLEASAIKWEFFNEEINQNDPPCDSDEDDDHGSTDDID